MINTFYNSYIILVSFIEKFQHNLLKPITNIINKSLKIGKFSLAWKFSLIKPIPQKANAKPISSFKLIKNLLFFSKFIEKAALLKYILHLNNTNNFATNNSAYKLLDSIEILITKVNNDI